MPITFQPKCLRGRAIYVTHDKFVRPCCYFLDHGWEPNSDPAEGMSQAHENKVTWLRSESTNLKNFDNINQILEGQEYQEFFQMLSDAAQTNDLTNLPPKCIKKCSSDQPVKILGYDYTLTNNQTNEKKQWEIPGKHLHKYLNGVYPGTSTIQVDLTHRCRLGCSKCQRFVPYGPNKGERRKFLNEEFTVEDIAKIVGDGTQYRFWCLCGSIGDAIYNPNLFEILRYIKKKTIGEINIFTNGSGKTKEWWEELFSFLNPVTDDVIFTVDGLKDTAHLYRKYSNFDQSIEAMKVGASKGFRKNAWQYIVFNFNEHQVEEAEMLAKEIGINFLLLKSERWSGPNDPLLPSKKWLSKNIIDRFNL